MGKLSEESLKELWYGSEYTKIRESVIDGTFKYCNKNLCPYLRNEAARQEQSSAIRFVNEAEMTNYENCVKDPVQYLPQAKVINFAYNKSCNLSCPSCRKEIIQSDKNTRSEDAELSKAIVSELSDDDVLLYIIGSGDPFGSRHYWEFLTSDLLRNKANLELMLHTNATLFTKQRWDKISHLKCTRPK